MVLPSPSLLCFCSCHLTSFPSLFFPSDGLSCAVVPVILPLHVGETQRRLDNRPTFLSKKKTKNKKQGEERNKTHQPKQMRPCTAWRTSSSLMDTSYPNIPPPLPLPRPPHPQPASLPHPRRHPTANTMKSWRTDPAPGWWMAMKEGLWWFTGMAVVPGSPKRMVEAAVTVAVPTTTTTNPGTGASRDGRAKTGAKLTPTPWESRSPQTVGKTWSFSFCFSYYFLLIIVRWWSALMKWSEFVAWGLLHHIFNGAVNTLLPPSFSPRLCSSPGVELPPTFLSIPVSAPLSNQVLGMGGGIMCAGVLICHMGPWSCNQNSSWANLHLSMPSPQTRTHTQGARFARLPPSPVYLHTYPISWFPLFHYLHNESPINNADFI